MTSARQSGSDRSSSGGMIRTDLPSSSPRLTVPHKSETSLSVLASEMPGSRILVPVSAQIVSAP